MDHVKFSGVMSALISSVDENGVVQESQMRRIMDWHLKAGLSGFYLTGGTGEGPVLQKETRKQIVEIAKDQVGNRGSLIAHVGAIDLKTAVELAKHAGEVGMDAISSVPPFFFDYDEQGIADYYKALSDASGLPVLIYASPMAGVNITWDMVDRFMDIPNVIGLKWTSYDYFTMHRIKELRGGNINVINGPDECLLCGLTMGADGGIGSTYNMTPHLFAGIYENFKKGDMETARKLQFQVNKLIEVLLQFDVVAGIKEVMTAYGYDAGYPIYPLKRIREDERTAFWTAMRSAGLDAVMQEEQKYIDK